MPELAKELVAKQSSENANLYKKFLGDEACCGDLKARRNVSSPPPTYTFRNLLEIQGLPPTIHGAASGAAECTTDPPRPYIPRLPTTMLGMYLKRPRPGAWS